MTFNLALTTDQYTQLRSESYAGLYMISFMKNRVVFAGQNTTDLSTLRSWAQFAYTDITVGAYTDVEYNMAILMGTTDDIKQATWRGRVREGAADATYVYCSESSSDFAPGSYFWIIDTYDLTNKLSRPDDFGVQLIDYDVPYRGQKPVVLGLRTAYAGWVDAETGKLRIAFDISQTFHPDPARSIYSFEYTFKPGSYTVISGSLLGPVVTVDLDPGEQWVKVQVVDDAGVTLTRKSAIKVHDADYPPDSGFEGISLSADFSKPWSLSTTAFVGVNDVLNRTFFIVWRSDEQYGGVAGGLAENNIAFCGWLQREGDSEKPDQTYGVLSDAKFECVSVGTALARLEAQGLAFKLVTVPTLWNDITNLTWWAAITSFLQEYYTVGDLCDIDNNDRGQTYKFPLIVTKGDTGLTAAQGIADQVNAYVEFAPDGRVGLYRSVEYLDADERALLEPIANWTASDIAEPGGATRSIDPNPGIGKTDGDGAYYNASTTQVQAYTVRAPGYAQGEGGGSSTLSNQILASTTDPVAALLELRTRAGTKFNIDNNTERLDMDYPDGYTGLIPSRAQVYTWTLDIDIPGPNGVQRISYDTSILWLLESVSYTPGFNGTCAVKAKYLRLAPVGEPGEDTTKLAPNQIPPALPDLGLPAFNFEFPEVRFPDIGLLPTQVSPAALLPPKGQIAAFNGQYAVVKNTDNAYWLRNLITLKKPQSRQVTPPDLGAYKITAVLLDNIFSTRTRVRCWILASDTTNSAVWRTSNIGALPPVWTKGVDVPGIYTMIKQGKGLGEILIKSDNAGADNDWTLDYDFTTGDEQGWQVVLDPTAGPIGQFNNGYEQKTGIAFTDNIEASSPLMPTGVITSVTFTYNPVTQGVNIYTGLFDGATGGPWTDGSNISTEHIGAFLGAKTLDLSWNTQHFDQVYLYYDPRVGSSQEVTTRITHVHLEGTGGDPFGGEVVVRYSPDHGATFEPELVVDPDGGGISGFDVQRAGNISYAGAKDTLYKASTLGGAYSSFCDCTGAYVVAVEILWYKWQSRTLRRTSSATPDVVIALSRPDDDGGTLYVVDGETGAKSNITPAVGIFFDTPHCITSYYGTHLMVYGRIEGVYKLYQSYNSGLEWDAVDELTVPKFLTNRRGDSRATTPAGLVGRGGQIYLIEDDHLNYSSKWASNWTDTDHFPRVLPAAEIDAVDVLG